MGEEGGLYIYTNCNTKVITLVFHSFVQALIRYQQPSSAATSHHFSSYQKDGNPSFPS